MRKYLLFGHNVNLSKFQEQHNLEFHFFYIKNQGHLRIQITQNPLFLAHKIIYL